MEKSMPVFTWTVTDGLRRQEFSDTPAYSDTSEPQAVLEQNRSR